MIWIGFSLMNNLMCTQITVRGVGCGGVDWGGQNLLVYRLAAFSLCITDGIVMG